ncbi:MAG TPA: 3'-5' exonuclease, partial [Steroidobacter sp.]|nr:3'-5' exonuclease [Steroidobacter sp.]
DLEDVARLEEQLEDLFAHSQPQGKAQVELMTIHAAKGLEFDTVIVPGLHRTVRGENRELLRWTRIAGPDGGIVLAPLRAEGAQPDSIYRWIELLEQQRLLRERARLLYVAATRAKHTLHLVGVARASMREREVALNEPSRGSMLRMLWRTLAPQFATAAPSSSMQASGAAAPSPQSLKRLPLTWTPPPAPPALTTPQDSMLDLRSQRPEFDWVSEVSRRVGTLVHRELDRLTRDGALSNDPSRHRARLSAELAELGVPAERCPAACERVLLALERTLSDRRGRWLLGLESPLKEAESEFALSGVAEGQVITGVVDRTFVDAQGVRWVVDFKTSTHEGGGLEAFLAEEVKRYRPQLARYVKLMSAFKPRERIKAALYFPLLQEWREVPVESA